MQKWETHLHTDKGSSCGKVKAKKSAKLYHKYGYNGIVITNHFNISNFTSYYKCASSQWIDEYLKEYQNMVNCCHRYNITVILGLELSLRSQEKSKRNPEYSEILLYGITPSDLQKYQTSFLKLDIDSFYNLANQNGWICIQSHPFRKGVKQIETRYLHGLETYNGNPRHNNHNDLAKECALQNHLIQTGGSDFHQVQDIGYGMLFPDDVVITNEKEFALALTSGQGIVLREKQRICPFKTFFQKIKHRS